MGSEDPVDGVSKKSISDAVLYIGYENNQKHIFDVGVHIGDGNMHSQGRTHKITYSGNLNNEKEFYLEVLKPLIKSVYNTEPKYYERKSDNSVLLVINSKKLIKFKNKVLGLPIGKKQKSKFQSK